MVEWTNGVEYWTGLLECHTHKIGIMHTISYTYTIPWPQTWRKERKKNIS